jgi:glucose-6-phosphate isomerase
MTLSTWTQVQLEAKRLGAMSARDVAASLDAVLAVWEAPHLTVDVGRQKIDAPAMKALFAFAGERKLADAVKTLFAGEIVNASERRPALHWTLRGGGDDLPQVKAMRATAQRATEFAKQVRQGGLGFEVKTVLHIGIGGSDLGPRLVWDALRDYGSKGPELKFCANVDPEDFEEAVAGVDPATTLVIVVSKSFKTPETASNAQLAKAWLVAGLGEVNANAHLAAVSSAPDKAKAWGADEARIFPMDEAVGGRYSVWSTVGLSLEIGLGSDVWRRFLKGGRDMDLHVAETPLDSNIAVKLALLDIWLHTAIDLPSRTVLAYAHRLRRLPDFLQQLEMESNGKSAADQPGGLIGETSPFVWGSVGTLGQHSFHQLLHQGTRHGAIEFIASMDAGKGDVARGRALLANAFAQGEALLAGRSAAEAETQLLAQGMDVARARAQAPHMDMPGQRGSITILLDTLSPESFGALIALYEHRTFCAGVLWGINPFDQWGVERGKVLAEELDTAIAGGDAGKRDPSTLRLVERARTNFRE